MKNDELDRKNILRRVCPGHDNHRVPGLCTILSHCGTGLPGVLRFDLELALSDTTFASRKRAILAVLRWVQSKREYENIMQHLSTTIGEKGDWKANEARVIAFLAQDEQPREYGYDAGFIPGAQKVIITPSHYAENLHAIYTHLPDAPAVSPGHLNEFRQPLIEVPPMYLHSYTTYITIQHGR